MVLLRWWRHTVSLLLLKCYILYIIILISEQDGLRCYLSSLNWSYRQRKHPRRLLRRICLPGNSRGVCCRNLERTTVAMLHAFFGITLFLYLIRSSIIFSHATAHSLGPPTTIDGSSVSIAFKTRDADDIMTNILCKYILTCHTLFLHSILQSIHILQLLFYSYSYLTMINSCCGTFFNNVVPFLFLFVCE